MKPLIRRQLIIKPSTIQGYGVFANEDIQENAVIEECYALKMNHESADFIDYVFNLEKNSYLLPLGSGAIYNHSDNPNADYEMDIKNRHIIFFAKKPIKKGEEIFISYGSYWFSVRQLKAKAPSKYYRMKQLLALSNGLVRLTIVVSVLISAILILQKI